MKAKRTLRRQLPKPAHSVALRDAYAKVLRLEDELLYTHERANTAEVRCLDVARELRQEKARASRETQLLRHRNETQARRFLVTLRELADTRDEARAERAVHRLEVALLQARCNALGAMCHALLLAMKGRARGTSDSCGHAATALPPYAQGSA
jgi:hypothetical protein